MKITPEIAERINILYQEIGVKSQVAKIIGCSAATVSRYIDPNFSLKKEEKNYTFEGEVGNSEWIADIFKMFDDAGRRFCELCMLGEDELNELKKLQKEIYI